MPIECQPLDFPDAEDSGGNKTSGFLFLVELGGGVMAQLVKCLHEHGDLHLIPRTRVMPGVMVVCASCPSMGGQIGGSVRLAGWPPQLT